MVEDKRLRSDAGNDAGTGGAFQVPADVPTEPAPEAKDTKPAPEAKDAQAPASEDAAGEPKGKSAVKKKKLAATKGPSRQRGRAAPDPARRSKGADDRALSEDRQLSDDERLDMFRSQFSQAALPDLPPIPGYHVCWLTTTNTRDTIAMRTRLGYEPVKPEDIPGWDHATMKTGEYTGLIAGNELLAFKLPLHLYERYMREAHHEAPLREQEKLTANVDALKESAQSKGADVVEFDGMQELREPAPPAPTFASEAERGG